MALSALELTGIKQNLFSATRPDQSVWNVKPDPRIQTWRGNSTSNFTPASAVSALSSLLSFPLQLSAGPLGWVTAGLTFVGSILSAFGSEPEPVLTPEQLRVQRNMQANMIQGATRRITPSGQLETNTKQQTVGEIVNAYSRMSNPSDYGIQEEQMRQRLERGY